MDCITAKDHKLRSHLVFVPFNATTMFLMACIASRDYNPFMSINTTNYKSNQIRSGNWCYTHRVPDKDISAGDMSLSEMSQFVGVAVSICSLKSNKS